MHFYGGEYTYIKFIGNVWSECTKSAYENSNTWIMGYKENDEDDCAFIPGDDTYNTNLRKNWKKLIGISAYVCKPKTQLTKD